MSFSFLRFPHLAFPSLGSPRQNIGLFCLISVVCWTLIPLALFPNPPLDVVISFAWSRDLAWGYTQHPPLLSWMLHGADLVAGSPRTAYIFSGLCLALTHFLAWHLGRRLGLTEAQCALGLLINSASFYALLPIPEFNHNVIQMPIWLGLMVLSLRALETGSWVSWLALGVLGGLGLLAKYSVALILGCIGLHALVFAAARQALKTPKPYISALVALLIFSPHVAWMIDTDFLTLKYASDRTSPAEGLIDHILHPLDFLLGQLGALAPSLAVIAALFYAKYKAKSGVMTSGPATSFKSRSAAQFAYWFLLAPLSTVLVTSLVTGSEFRHMWGVPMFGLLGLSLAAVLQSPSSDRPARPIWVSAIGVQVVFLCVLLGQALIEPLWKTKPSRIHYPGYDIAQAITDRWKTEMGTPLAYVAGDVWTAGNVVLFSSDKPSLFVGHDLDQAPWIDENDLNAKGVVVIWRGNAEALPTWASAYDDEPFKIYNVFFSQQTWVTDAPKIEISWINVPPRGKP